MAAGNQINVYERLKNALMRCRQKEPWFGYFPPIGIDDYERLTQRCRNINKCIRELYTYANITKEEFKNYLHTDAQANTVPGEKRLILLLAKLNKDLANEEFHYLIKNSKEKAFIKRLENHEAENNEVLSVDTDEIDERSNSTDDKADNLLVEDEKSTSSVTKNKLEIIK